jgi:hypothetical protein
VQDVRESAQALEGGKEMMPIDYAKGLLVCVDPGLRGSGLAMYKLGVLEFATYVTNPDKSGRGPTAHAEMASAILNFVEEPFYNEQAHFLVEFPQVYPGPSKIDVNDLLDIAGVASAITTMMTLYQCQATLPRAWKGNIKKEIMTERIRASLTDQERNRIVSVGAKDHNTLDAVGLGLWRMGRLNRKVYS